jgi:hypothetical protein
MAWNLNRRHKVSLFLVLVAAGLSLFSEASLKQTAGIVVLGLAATWFIGSLSVRVVGIVLSLAAFACGLFLVVVPTWDTWRSYRWTVPYYLDAKPSFLGFLRFEITNSDFMVPLAIGLGLIVIGTAGFVWTLRKTRRAPLIGPDA